MAIKTIKILGAVVELPAEQHCQFSPFGPLYEVNTLDWQCYLAGSSKTAPKILIFSMAIGADYSFELISIETYAPQFIGHNNVFLDSVDSKDSQGIPQEFPGIPGNDLIPRTFKKL